MTKPFCILIPALLLIASCKNAPEKPFDAAVVKCDLEPAQCLTAGKFIYNYLLLKDALAATDHNKAHQAATAMQQEWGSFKIFQDTAAIPQAAQQRAFLELVSMKNDLTKIISHNDESCEPQRICFKNLSDSLYAFIENRKLTNLHLYRHYCPMAMNGKGAWWLSASRQVKNPYFGSKMLTCGELVDTLK